MKARVVRDVCGIIERMEDEKIERREHILVEDMTDGSKYALIHLEEGERIFITDEDDDEIKK